MAMCFLAIIITIKFCVTLQTAVVFNNTTKSEYSFINENSSCPLQNEDLNITAMQYSLFDKSNIPLSDMANLVVDLHKHFFTRGVFIVNTEDTQSLDIAGSQLLVHFQRLLSMNSICSAVMPFATLLHAPEVVSHSQSMALFVTLYESLQLRRYLQQLWQGRALISNIWLMYLHRATMESFLRGVNLPFDGEFLVVQPECGGSLLLTEVYRVAPGMPLRQSHYGRWGTTPRKVWPDLELYKRRSDLTGLEIRVTTIDSAMCSLTRTEDNRIKIGGFIGDIWQAMEKIINFTTTVMIPADNSTGAMQANGSWNGMMGMVQREEVNLALGTFTISSKRKDVVDFTMPLFLTKYYVFIRQPKEPFPSWGSLLEPFSKSLWFTMLATLLAHALWLAVISRVGHRYFPEYYFNVSDAFFYVFGALAQKGCKFPRSSSSRVVCFGSHLVSLVLMASYSASLVSFLTVRREHLPFHDFQSLLEDGTYKLGLMANSFEYDFFSLSTDPLLQKVFTQLIAPDPSNMHLTEKDGLDRVCSTNNYAFLTVDAATPKLITMLNCSIIAIPMDVHRISAGIAVRKNSPYLWLLNFHLQALRNAGVLQKLRPRRWLDMVRAISPLHQVRFWDVLPLLTLFGFGQCLALLLLALELLSTAIFKQFRSVSASILTRI